MFSLADFIAAIVPLRSATLLLLMFELRFSLRLSERCCLPSLRLRMFGDANLSQRPCVTTSPPAGAALNSHTGLLLKEERSQKSPGRIEDLATNTKTDSDRVCGVSVLISVASPEAQCADSLIDPHFLLNTHTLMLHARSPGQLA